MSRRPSCPAEHSRQGYSGSYYSNKVCGINRADVKKSMHIAQNSVEAQVTRQET